MSGPAPGQPIRPPHPLARPLPPVLWLALAGLLVALGAWVFLPSLAAGFVSDAFIYLEQAQRTPAAALLDHFVPAPDRWYRPLTTVVFWLEHRAFGFDPIGYHVVALLCHLVSTVLLFRLGRRLTRDDRAAAVGAVAFLFTIHAHEVFFDVADLHNALGGPALLGAVLAYLAGVRLGALALAAVALAIDENGLLALPLAAVGEAVFGVRSPDRRAIGAAALRLAPLALLTAAYLTLRVVVGGGFHNETVPCREPRCLAVAVLEYVNRLFVRPDALLASIWDHRVGFAIGTLAGLALLALLLRPWVWRQWRPAIFAVGWIAGTAAFAILALFPYAADRFLYIPDMGLGLLFACAAAEGARAWAGAGVCRRRGLALAALAGFLWLALGPGMLRYRGQLWDRAGAEARGILDGVIAVLPDPPPRARLVLRNVPDSYTPHVPPRNTGPYVFRNGLAAALRLRYGRPDLVVRKFSRTGDEILLAVDGTRVVLLKGPH